MRVCEFRYDSKQPACYWDPTLETPCLFFAPDASNNYSMRNMVALIAVLMAIEPFILFLECASILRFIVSSRQDGGERPLPHWAESESLGRRAFAQGHISTCSTRRHRAAARRSSWKPPVSNSVGFGRRSAAAADLLMRHRSPAVVHRPLPTETPCHPCHQHRCAKSKPLWARSVCGSVCAKTRVTRLLTIYFRRHRSLSLLLSGTFSLRLMKW